MKQSGHAMKRNTVIFDLDGTLALIDARRNKSIIPGKRTNENGNIVSKLDWDVFFNPENIHLDEPNLPVIKMAQMFAQDGFKIIIFSGRNDRSFHTTKEWLLRYNVPHNLLVMRPDKFQSSSWPVARGNPATSDMKFMSDEILKKKMLDTFLNKDEVFLVVDDRDKVVKMWRDLGLNTFQVAQGDF
jgi:hypothetical protein